MQFWDTIKEFLDVAATVVRQRLKPPQRFGERNFSHLQMEGGGGLGRTYSDAVAVTGLFCRAQHCRQFLICFHLKTETKSYYETPWVFSLRRMTVSKIAVTSVLTLM